MRKIMLALVLFFAFMGAGMYAVAATLSTGTAPVDVDDARQLLIHIPEGTTHTQIGQLLQENGLIHNQLVFLYLTKRLGYEGKLKAGDYVLSPSQSLREIIEVLHAGEVVRDTITFPEGYTVAQIKEKMIGQGIVTRAEAGELFAKRDWVAEWLPTESEELLLEPLEGYLFPDTYTIDAATDGEQLLQMMVDQFRSIWNEERKAKLDESGLTIHQAVTLASIVEREAQRDEERPLIAAVYLNRLKINMKLDADPTVLYALGKEPGEPLYIRELTVDSPYNTYKYAELPPGPIANPGLASIDAVLNPADVPYLYFVAKNDGSHVFATSYNEHLKNVAEYQR